ncbi:uncharacterized protein CHSO_1053 [Chryseobacterium sp. StRB126]|uniref:hypothetical protein n=1 Tax=Chryseobacterium sp. StRB126 TaxID=878220 RepID=UPI0004E98D76|nr:hypothetical protein [Chryseobacterium sp. StRB126]BAP30090.1 uncharacterized protein CHSO_1053 [Chryseobacterium sp. StRB126]
MNLTDYLQLPISERKQIVTEPVGIKDPLWMERLKTAIKEKNPWIIIFNCDLMDEYHTLKKV